MRMDSRKSNLQQNQSGLVSFIVVSMLMLVITLFVLSFARIVSREQLQTLDRQLNSQALYAAESGVNDAMKAIGDKSSLLAGTYNACDDFTTAANNPTTIINPDLGDNVSYSCLLVDPTPTEIIDDGINQQESTVYPLKAANGSSIDRVEISWDSDLTGPANISGCVNNATLPNSWPSTCEVGMIRFELLPFGSGLSSSQMVDSQAVGLLKPFGTGGVSSSSLSSFVGSNQGNIVGTQCNSAGIRRCTLTINNVSSNLVYLRIRSIYRNTPVTIRIFNGLGANPLETTGAQVAIDVTGRAGGVTKRIKVQRSLPDTTANAGNVAPEFALQSENSICKRFTYRPGNFSSSPTTGMTSAECDPEQP